jgi:hypothetical protein
MPTPTRAAGRTLLDALAVKLGSGLWIGLSMVLLARLHVPRGWLPVTMGLRLLGVAGLLHVVLRKWGRYSDDELGLKASGATALQALGGAAVGALAAGLAAAVSLRAGALALTRVEGPDAGTLALGLVGVLFAALFEELAYRTGITAVLAGRFGRPAAVGVSALAFAAGHLHNAHVSASGLANVFLAGVWFALLFLDRSNRPSAPALGWATGAHAGWNSLMLLLGLDDAASLRCFAASAQDAFWTGGASGFEAGFATTLVLLAATAPLLARAARP